MNYEKAYKAVLQTATQWIKDGCTDKEKICLESVFPELRESEDERIRKEIVATIEQCPDDFLNPKNRDRMLEWLEKKKEQIPIERIVLASRRVLNNWLYGCDFPDVSEDFGELESALREFDNAKEQKPTKDKFEKAIGVADKWQEGYEAGVYDAERKLKSTEWSEKDKDLLERVIAFLAEDKTLPEWKLYVQKLKEWLKSLPERFDLKPTKEWSKEDEDKIRQIERIAQQAGCTQKLQEEIHDWLKSLRPRSSWKPSEEQIRTLYCVAYGMPDPDGKILMSLCNDLEKQK